MEQFFHSECPLDLTKCNGTDGFTIAMWFSFVAGRSDWADIWPSTTNKECPLVSIRNNIMVRMYWYYHSIGYEGMYSNNVGTC